MALFSGLDLGKMTDNAAWMLDDPDVSVWPPIHRIRSIKLWEIGTKYEVVQLDLKNFITRRKIEGHKMAVEINGPGVPVVETMMDSMPADIQPIFTCGGSGVTNGPDDTLHVAKGQVLIATVQAVLVSDRLRVANVFWREELYRQLEVFGVKISKAGNEQFEAIGEAKDDMVMSLALTLFIAEHFSGIGRDQLAMIPAAVPPADKMLRAAGTAVAPHVAQNEWARLAGPVDRHSAISRAIFGPGGRPTSIDRIDITGGRGRVRR